MARDKVKLLPSVYKQDHVDIPAAHEVVRQSSDGTYLDDERKKLEARYRKDRVTEEKERASGDEKAAAEKKKLESVGGSLRSQREDEEYRARRTAEEKFKAELRKKDQLNHRDEIVR